MLSIVVRVTKLVFTTLQQQFYKVDEYTIISIKKALLNIGTCKLETLLNLSHVASIKVTVD